MNKILSTLFLALSVLMPLNLWAQEPYAVLTTDTTLILNQSVTGVTYGQTLTFYYDDQKVARNGMDIGPFAYLEHGFGESQRPWHDVRESITDVVFDSSMANDTTLISTGWWFYGCTNLKRTSGWQYLPTANIVDMWGMFENCSSLSSNPVEGGPDFSAFNTASLKRTCYLFHGCTSMTSIDLSTFNTANVTETEGMFKDCAALTTIYVGSGWTMANVSGNWEDDMFSGSTSLVGGAGTTYDASNIGVSYAHIDGGPDNPGYLTSNGDTPYVVASEAYAVLSDDDVVLSQSATGITYGKKLTFYYDNQKSARNGMSVDFTDSMLREWNSSSSMITSVVFDSSFANDTTLTSTAWWFYNLGNLTTVTGIENLNTNHVTNMYSMFSDCSKLTSLDVTGFNTSNVTNMGYMFVGCSGLTTLDVRGFNTSNVTNMRNMFDSCSGLTSLDVSNFNTANVTNMYGMFMNCSGLTTLDLSSFNTAKVEVMENMFCQNTALTTISVDGTKWSTAAVPSSTSMFYMCPNLVGGKGTTYDSNHVDASYAHIDGGMANPGYFTAKGGLADPLLARLYDNLALTTTDGNADGGNNDLSGSIDAAQTSLVRAMWNLQELPTDESYCVWMDAGIPALNTNTWSNSTQTDAMRGLYARLYHGIILANNYLANQHDGDMGKQAEARFLRALQYYYLMDHFGNVPLLTDTIDRQPLPVWEATPSDIELLTCEEMFSYIENELQESLNSLPATNSYGRATATAARLLLARLYLNSEVYTGTARWQEARSYAESVINGGTFQLAPIYRNLFMGDNDSNGAQQEIILPAIYDGNTRTDYGGTTFLVASSFTNGEGDNGTTQVWAGNVSKPDFVNKFFTQTADIPYASPEQTASAAGDDRALFYGINHSYELRNGDSFSDGFPYQKFTNVRSNGTSPVSSKFADTDFPLMRLGEAYLIAAEADARLNGSATSMQGTQYINMLRNRANATTSTAGYSLSDICDEWSREMGYEAVRRTTLIRFGRFGGQTDYSWAWKGGSYDGTAFDAGMNTYPIPAVEVGSTPEPYVVLTDSNTVMTFYYDGQKATRVGIDINNSYLGDSPSPYGTATSAVFDASFANYYPTSTAYWFQNCKLLTTITGIEYLHTEDVTSTEGMFDGCSGLTSLDLSHFDTQNVTNMGGMFDGCSGLTSLDLSGFNTENVTDMSYMFFGCSGLTSLDLSGFNTENVTDMSHMFSGCSGLTSLEVSNFKTDNVTGMTFMFGNCDSLTSLDLSNFKTDNVTDMSWMFSGCSSLTSLDLSSFNTQNVTSMTNMFMACSSLTSLDVTHFNTQNVMLMVGMFAGCSSLTSLDLSSFNTQNVMSMVGMFSDCSSLTTIYVGDGWSTASVTNGEDMFTGCTSLVGGAGTAYDSLHVDYTYAHIDGGISNPGYFTSIESLRRWDFTKWSSETIANLKADAANSKITGWSDVEKRADAEADSEPTEAAKDNCFWLDAETTDANGVAISELEGLVFDANYCSKRSLAIAVNYPSTSLGDYAGGAYLWLGGKNSDCFTIPNVKNGQTITIEVESHKSAEARGITLIAGSTELESFTPTTKASYSWTITEDCDVIVRNTNGCHIYTITVEGAGIPTNSLEIYAVETNSTITPNQPIMATQSVVVTPGNDTEWGTKYSIGIDHDSQINTIEFVASIYYPNNTTSQVFNGSMYGTNNPMDGELVEGTSTGNSYKHYLKNLPHSGGYVVFEPLQDGSLIVPIHVNAEKQFYVVDGNGKALTDIQIKDANGQTLKLLASPLCAISTESTTTAFVSLNVKQGERYYMFCTGSKMRFGGYVFSKQSIEIDSTTMAGVKDLLESEPYAVLSEENTVLTFYYDKKREERGGRLFQSGTEVYWPNYVTGVTKVSFDESFADFSPTSTSSWFAGFNSLTSVEGMEYLNTEHVTSMISMFQYCENLTSLDLSRLQTGHVETMTNMFYGCKRLANLNLSGFSIANVTSLASMFYGCQSLTMIDLSSFNTSNVTRMEEMFQDCAGLTTLDLTNFNTENVENMTLMFAGCTNLATIYAGSGWSVAKAADSRQMFYDCTSLVGGQGTVYDAEYTDKTYAHIDGGTSNPGYLTLKLAMGDANGDGNINIADAVSTVTNILGQPTEATFYKYAADMNTDQVIDIFDVTLIVNAAFDAASPAPAMTRGSASNIMMEHISMTADADYIYLGIDQPERFTATQFDVTLPEGMELVDARLASASTDHQLTFVKRGDNEYRVIGLSMSNTTFRSMNGQLIKLEVSGSAVDSDVKMSNVLFVTPTATVMTSIDKCLNTAKMADDSLYDLKGQRLSKQQLGKGIYIMNHKKVIIK